MRSNKYLLRIFLKTVFSLRTTINSIILIIAEIDFTSLLMMLIKVSYKSKAEKWLNPGSPHIQVYNCI